MVRKSSLVTSSCFIGKGSMHLNNLSQMSVLTGNRFLLRLMRGRKTVRWDLKVNPMNL